MKKFVKLTIEEFKALNELDRFGIFEYKKQERIEGLALNQGSSSLDLPGFYSKCTEKLFKNFNTIIITEDNDVMGAESIVQIKLAESSGIYEAAVQWKK